MTTPSTTDPARAPDTVPAMVGLSPCEEIAHYHDQEADYWREEANGPHSPEDRADYLEHSKRHALWSARVRTLESALRQAKNLLIDKYHFEAAAVLSELLGDGGKPNTNLSGTGHAAGTVYARNSGSAGDQP